MLFWASKPPAPEISHIWKKIDDDIAGRRIKRAKWKKDKVDKDAEAKDNLGVQEQNTDRIQAVSAQASSGVAKHSGTPEIPDRQMLRSGGGKYVKTKSIDRQQNSRKTAGPGNLGHLEFLK